MIKYPLKLKAGDAIKHDALESNYEVVGVATGAGNDFRHEYAVVYKNKDGELFFRSDFDFGSMTLVKKGEGNE